MKTTFRKTMLLTLILALALAMAAQGALACTAIYVGSALTADGSAVFGRSEDYSNSQNKLFYVAPAGKHAAGEAYDGCYGFSWTFTHDSYGYTAFSDDNGDGVEGVCPDCGDTHPHTPYEAAGTNDQGVSMSATETIGGSEEIEAVDPYEDAGIEEAEITTVILSEAATAREGIELLASIYDTAGACDGSGIFIADATETWYIENVSGHQYIAVKLSDSMTMTQPNMSIIGEIDLSDTDNVIASAGLIETAQTAGTFVGDADKGVINYTMSYCGGSAANPRMVNALGWLDESCSGLDSESITPDSTYFISNTDDEGNVTAMHTGIALAENLTIADILNFYHIGNIGYERNLETHVFQITGEGETGTVEWVAMDDASLGLFIPYFPMLTTDTTAAYQLSTAEAVFTEEEPAEGLYYATAVNRWVDGERVKVEGFVTLPENWKDSMYWSFDALSNLYKFGGLTDEQKAHIDQALADKQAEIIAAFDEFKQGEVTAETATAWSMACAEDAHALAVTLVEEIIAE